MKKGPVRRPSGAVAEGLKTALLNEVEGREFYRMAAKNAARDGVRQMFEFLMREEERHYETIVEQAARMAEGRPPRLSRGVSGKRAIRKFRSPLFPPDFVARGRGADAEVAALSIGMTLEKRAIHQFAVLRRRVKGDPAAEKLFDGLIAWERDHLEILARQYAQLREMYWEQARFWPF
jgi:rubrerythrin